MKLRAVIWLAILFVTADAAPVHAQDVTEDWNRQVAIALQNNNCELALSLTGAARRTKDPEADYRFGLLYEWGQCVGQDDARAAHYAAAFDVGFTAVVPRGCSTRQRSACATGRAGRRTTMRRRGGWSAPARPACPRHITKQPCCFLIPTVATTTQARGKHSWAKPDARVM